jgi:hypothetical protein
MLLAEEKVMTALVLLILVDDEADVLAALSAVVFELPMGSAAGLVAVDEARV